MRSSIPLSTVLPPDAVASLVEATKTPCTEENPQPRRIAIDKAIERVKTKYPQFFQGATTP